VIEDGDLSQAVDLDVAQLQSGRVVYRRLTESVSFRLEVFLSPTRSLTETRCNRSNR
jgi:hypothetical protein